MEQQTEKMRKMAAIVALSANYDQAIQKDLMKIWLGLLEEYSASEVELGVKAVIREYEFKTRPPFAVLRKAIDRICGIRRIDPDEAIQIEAEAEWDRLLDDIADYGRYNKPELHPTTEYALRGMGGWDAACAWETSRLEWRRKEFIEKWIVAHGREEIMELGAYGVEMLAEGRQSVVDILGIDTKKKRIGQ